MLTFDSPLSEIAHDIHENYFSKPYPDGSLRTDHGMDHMVRAMIFGTLGYKLLCAAGLAQYNEKDLKFIQIALLLHDSAREGEGPDLWDKESGETIYQYLTKVLKVDAVKARNVADAMVNKDQEGESNQYQMAIQFGDCVDIYRIVNTDFNWNMIKLYEQLNNLNNKTAFRVLEQLIPECFAMIAQSLNDEVEASTSFNDLTRLLNEYPLLNQLYYESWPISDFDDLASSGDEISDAFVTMNLLFRGVIDISEPYQRERDRPEKDYPENYSGANQEIRKLRRRPQVKTWSRHEEKQLDKKGNPARSLSLVGLGSQIFTEVGGGVLVDKAVIKTASLENIDSGRGPKLHWKGREADQDVDEKMDQIRLAMRAGNASKVHNEIIADLMDWDCVMYSVDKFEEPLDIPRRVLQAIFLRDVYQHYPNELGEHVELPIYEFSTSLGFCLPKDNEELILLAFVEPWLGHLVSELSSDKSDRLKELEDLDLNEWLSEYLKNDKNVRFDHYYSTEFNALIRKRLDEARVEFLQDYKDYYEQYVFNKNIPSEELDETLIVLLRKTELSSANDSNSIRNVMDSFLSNLQHSNKLNSIDKKIDLVTRIVWRLQPEYGRFARNLVQDWFIQKWNGKNTDQMMNLVFGLGLMSQNEFVGHLKQYYAKKLKNHDEISPELVDKNLGDYYTKSIRDDILRHLKAERTKLQNQYFEVVFSKKETDRFSSAKEIIAFYDFCFRTGKLSNELVQDLQIQLLNLAKHEGFEAFFRKKENAFPLIKNLLNYGAKANELSQSGLHHQYCENIPQTSLAIQVFNLSASKDKKVIKKAVDELTALHESLLKQKAKLFLSK